MMIAKVSRIAAVAGVGLLAAAPGALGQSGPDAFERAVAAQARQVPQSPAAHPDAFERAVAAQASTHAAGVSVYSDALERAVTARGREPLQLPDAHQRAVSTLTSAFPSDAFERALENRAGSFGTSVLEDQHGRIEASSPAVPVSITTSGREIVWPQIGIGFGMGALLALGLVLTLRLIRARELAH